MPPRTFSTHGTRTLMTAVLFGLVGLLVTRDLPPAGVLHGQTAGVREDFTAVAIVNNNLASGARTVLMQVTRWSTE